MARSEPTSVEDITVPLSQDDDADARDRTAPVVLPRQTAEGKSASGRGRVRARRRSDDRPAGDADEPRPGRRVVRIVRHVQLWSVFKLALLGGLVFYVIFLVAAALGWSIANATGQVHHIEQFMRQIGFDNWTFNGAQLFRAAALAGAILLVAGSVLITLAAAIVNLIAEATGGVRFTVIEALGPDGEALEDDRDDPDG